MRLSCPAPTAIEHMSFWTWLFPRMPAVFPSPLSPAQAAQALRTATARGNITATGTVAGSVEVEDVLLYHRVPLRNSFKLHFRGQFVATAQGCELQGRFALPGLVVAFMLFWLGFCVLWTVLSAIQIGRVDPMLMPVALLPGPLMAGLGIGMVRLGQYLAAGDPATLSRVIRQALQSPPQ